MPTYETGEGLVASTRPRWYVKPERVLCIDDALEDIAVHAPGLWENELSEGPLSDWYAVSTSNEGIVAYFMSESDALSFRLRLIDRWFNG